MELGTRRRKSGLCLDLWRPLRRKQRIKLPARHSGLDILQDSLIRLSPRDERIDRARGASAHNQSDCEQEKQNARFHGFGKP